MVYIYNADILCDDCGREARKRLNERALAAYNGAAHADDRDPSNPDLIAALGFDPDDETAYDSGDYPKPTGDTTGGESDTPTHCGQCGEFQRNILTEDGMRYVIEAIAQGTGNPAVLAEWYDEYLSDRELRDVEFRPLRDDTVYRLRTFDLYRRNRMGKTVIAYIFGVDGKPAIFWGDDFAASPMHSVDGDDCLRSLLGFITLRPGDTDREYFDRYSETQMDFARSGVCEVLQLWADEDSRMPVIDYGMRVWVRIDDSGDYRPFHWVTEAAQEVAAVLCADPLTRDARAAGSWECIRAQSPDYRGVFIAAQNVPAYAEFRADVSLFWGHGDDAHFFDRELSDEELADFAEELITCDVD